MMRSGTSFFSEMAMADVETSRETRDLIRTLREMLRQAERGEVVLSSLRITNTQKDRWEPVQGGAERMRLDNKYRIELEMHARDRYARTPAPVEPVQVEIDKEAEALLNANAEALLLNFGSQTIAKPKPTFEDWPAPTTTRMKPKPPVEPPKPKTPVGASAGREIMFDD